MLIRQCYRWGRRGLFCCQRRVLKQARKRRTQLLPCATAALAFNVCDAECSVVSGLGCEINGLNNVPALIAAAQQADESAEPVWFLPYLSGERTPHNNRAKGFSLV